MWADINGERKKVAWYVLLLDLHPSLEPLRYPSKN